MLAKIIRQRCAALALLGTLLLGGCSAIKLGYEQLPSLAYWWFDGQLDFTEAQTPAVRETLEHLQRWHRQRELPLYADWLARVATLSEGPVQAEEVCQVEREALQRLDVLVREAVRQFGPLALQLRPRQIRHLARQFEEKNARWEEQWLQGSASERLARRLDKVVDRHADFYGSLTPAQRELLRTQLVQSAWSPEWGRQERLRQQGDLLGNLWRIGQEELSAAQVQAGLLGTWERWLVPASDADHQRWQAWFAQGCRNLAELHNTTSPEQRQRAARRLRAYEKDLRELASRS